MSQRVCKVPGSKWTHAEWIVSHMVRRPVYLEPTCGSAATLYAKPRSPTEIINDLDDRVVALFRVLRDRPEDLARVVGLTPYARAEWRECRGNTDVGDDLEKARRFLVESWRSHGARTGSRSGWRRDGKDNGRRGRSFAQEWADLPARIMVATERLRGVHIENRPAVQLLRTYRGPEVLVYLDPPYPAETSQGVRDVLYKHEMMTVEQHVELLAEALLHPGPLLLSSYRNDLYDTLLLAKGWAVVERAARGEHGVERVESLYLNPIAWAEQARVWQLDLLGGESC